MNKLLVWFSALSVCSVTLADQPKLADQYRDYQKSVQAMISGGREVAATDLERADLRTLQFLLNDLNKHVAAGDERRASEVKRRMEVALKRSQVVVDDGPRRKAAKERADRERRHREEMRQRERQHHELMNEMRRRSQTPY